MKLAIIGMAGRFPGANNIDEFWDNLLNSVESISSFSEAELRANGVQDQWLRDKSYVRSKGVINDIEFFDAEFFGYYPREAELMDPQHRLFLECGWSAFEDAGCNIETFSGNVGVFGSCSAPSYMTWASQSTKSQQGIDPLLKFGCNPSYLASRVSYKFNLRGPSLVVQTACSSSLVALHLARQSLMCGECDMALVGAASLSIPQVSGVFSKTGGIISSDKHCRAFDDKANGTVVGSAVAAIVIKRYDDAVRDHDTIRAVILGSAVNNDGNAKVGFTAPSVAGQQDVIKRALNVSGVLATDVSYVEAHGTGTALGDPIEIEALRAALVGGDSTNEHRCAIGSVKTNIGHADSASGIAGLIKTTLCLQHKMLVPSLNYSEANRNAKLAGDPFYVQRVVEEWPATTLPRRACVSSFGIGGTNAHVVLEDNRKEQSVERWKSNSNFLLLSAKSMEALQRYRQDLCGYLVSHPDIDMSDAAFTLQVGRKLMQYRYIAKFSDKDEAIAKLGNGTQGKIINADELSPACEGILIFGEMGSGELGPCIETLRYRFDMFDRHYLHCRELCLTKFGADISKSMASRVSDGNLKSELEAKSLQDLSTVALLTGLVGLWECLGLNSYSRVAGTGCGALAAGFAAGNINLQECLELAWYRSRTEEYRHTDAIQGGAPVSHSITGRPQYWSTRYGRWLTGHVRKIDILKDAFILESHGHFDDLFESLGNTDSIYTLGGLLSAKARATIDSFNMLNGYCELYRAHSDGAIGIKSISDALAHLSVIGKKVNWDAFYAPNYPSRISLPTYPFDKKRFWVDMPIPDSMPLTSAEEVNGDTNFIKFPSTFDLDNRTSDDQLRSTIHSVWKRAFGDDDITDENDFFAIGGHSFLAIELSDMLSEALSRSISPDILYEFPTITLLTKHFVSLNAGEQRDA